MARWTSRPWRPPGGRSNRPNGCLTKSYKSFSQGDRYFATVVAPAGKRK